MTKQICEVRQAGLQTTIQDTGRVARAQGIPVGGAVDQISLRLANMLVGNHRKHAALEITLQGPELYFFTEALVALVGAPFKATIDHQPFSMGRAVKIRAGQVLSIGTCQAGMRALLAIQGGWSGEEVFDSRSTNLQAKIGGLGRALQAGDLLSVESTESQPISLNTLVHPDLLTPIESTMVLRVLPAEIFVPELLNRPWTIGAQDRMGVRLTESITAPLHRNRPSWPTMPGAIQLPPDGSPIVLLPDAGTHGGYPVPFVVCQADLPRLGQLRTGAQVIFQETTPNEALEALRLQQAQLRMAERLLCGDSFC